MQTDAFKLTPEWVRLLAIDGVDRERGELLLVAEADGRIIGHGRIYPGAYGSKDRHVAQLGIALIKPYRDQGIGSAMMHYMMEWCIHVGYGKITAEVIALNARALHVFAKFGFGCEGQKKRQLLVRGRYEDEEILSIFPEGEVEKNAKTS